MEIELKQVALLSKRGIKINIKKRGTFLPFFILFILNFNTVKSQNLIINSSFDSLNICCERGALCAPQGWFWFNKYFGEFNIDAKTGNISVRINCATTLGGSCRQYIISPLLCPLIKDENYTIHLNLRAVGFALDELGILFTERIPHSIDSCSLNDFVPQIKLINNRSFLYSKKGWFDIEQKYIANGTEKFIIIGNFKADKDLHWKRLNKNAFVADYLIDDISIIPNNAEIICDYKSFLDSVLHETRRHNFNKPCLAKGWVNLFPELLDSIYLPKKIELGKTTILENVFFDFDKAILLQSSFVELLKLVDLLKSNQDKKIKLIGHTDNKGTDEYNFILSEQRAKAVADYLIENGISKERVSYEGKGNTEAIETNETIDGRTKNRRVEFIIF
jgi:hypothetical protein